MDSRVNRTLLANAMISCFLSGIAGRIFIISMPTLANSLETDIIGISWALISYSLSSVCLALVFGRIGDLYGRQTVFLIGFLVFTVATFLCGLSRDVFQLILFRLLQGIGGAMIQSQARALAMEAMPESSAGKAQGLMTIAFQSGFLLGPSLGGLILDYIHWRGVFFFLVPIGLVGMFLSWMNKRSSGDSVIFPGKGPRSSIDYLGAALLVVTTVSLFAMLDRRVMRNIPSGWETMLLLSSIGFFLGFLLREITASSPILHISLFKNRMFAMSTLSLLLVSISRSITSLVFPFYLQEVLYISPTLMGILFMSAPIFTLGLSPASGYLTDKVGPKLPATAGVVLIALASLLGAILGPKSHWILPAFILALGGAGFGLFSSSNHAAMIGSVPKEHRGVASGTVQMMFALGSTLGISLGSFLMTEAFRSSTGLNTATPTPSNPTAFVAALNYTFLGVAGIGLVAMFASFMRGEKVEGASGTSDQS